MAVFAAMVYQMPPHHAVQDGILLAMAIYMASLAAQEE